MRSLFEDPDTERKAALGGVLADFLSDSKHGLDGAAILQAVDDSATARQGWDFFSDRLTALTATSDYKALQMTDVLRQALNFLEQRAANSDPAADPQGAARVVLSFLADRLEQGDFDQYLLLGAGNPNGFYQVLQTLSHSIDDGDLMAFFQEARDALPPAQ